MFWQPEFAPRYVKKFQKNSLACLAFLSFVKDTEGRKLNLLFLFKVLIVIIFIFVPNGICECQSSKILCRAVSKMIVRPLRGLHICYRSCALGLWRGHVYLGSSFDWGLKLLWVVICGFRFRLGLQLIYKTILYCWVILSRWSSGWGCRSVFLHLTPYRAENILCFRSMLYVWYPTWTLKALICLLKLILGPHSLFSIGWWLLALARLLNNWSVCCF